MMKDISLRLSITDRCNLRCIYCMPCAGVPYVDHQLILRYETMVRVARILNTNRWRRGDPAACPFPEELFWRLLVPEFTHLDEQGSARMVDVTDKTVAKTGVEMEALCAVSMAALTVYDMCKAVDRSMTTAGIRLIEKTGGKSGAFVRDDPLTRLRYQHAT